MLSKKDPAGTVEHEYFYSFSASGIYNSEIVVCCFKTMQKTVFLNVHRPGHRHYDWVGF